MIVQRPTPNDTKSAETRRAAFLAAIPPSVLYAEDKLPSVVRAMNASSRSKLHRIYGTARRAVAGPRLNFTDLPEHSTYV